MAANNLAEVLAVSPLRHCELAVENQVRRQFPVFQQPQAPQFLVFPTGKAPYHWQVRALATNRVLSRHKLLAPALRRAGWLNKHRGETLLARCAFETPESAWGKCDGGFRCPDLGIVHHLASEQDLCFAHFLQAELP